MQQYSCSTHQYDTDGGVHKEQRGIINSSSTSCGRSHTWQAVPQGIEICSGVMKRFMFVTRYVIGSINRSSGVVNAVAQPLGEELHTPDVSDHLCSSVA